MDCLWMGEIVLQCGKMSALHDIYMGVQIEVFPDVTKQEFEIFTKDNMLAKSWKVDMRNGQVQRSGETISLGKDKMMVSFWNTY